MLDRNTRLISERRIRSDNEGKREMHHTPYRYISDTRHTTSQATSLSYLSSIVYRIVDCRLALLKQQYSTVQYSSPQREISPGKHVIAKHYYEYVYGAVVVVASTTRRQQ